MGAIQAPRSGARLFEIAPQGRYLIAQGLGPLQISPSEGNCQSKLQLLELVIALAAVGGERVTGRGSSGHPANLGVTVG